MRATVAKQGRNLAQVFEPWRKFEWAVLLLVWIASWFVMSVVPFLRHRMGRRYYSKLNAYFGYGVITFFMFTGPLVVPLTGGSPDFWLGILSPPMIVAWVLFVAFSIGHRVEMWRRDRRGEELHTYAMGRSVFNEMLASERHPERDVLPDEWIHKWIEPVAVFLAGVLALVIARNGVTTGVFSPVGVWLIISAFCLGIHSRIIYFYERQQLMDTQDAQIEARYMGDALEGKPADKTAGFVLAQSTVKAVKNDPGLKAAFEQLGDIRSVLSS